jgi:type IV pilus assembly protein PilW
MTRSRLSHLRAAKSGARMGGFGLIELMIAMVLGLVVMGAAFAVFMSNQSTFRANEGLNRIQENARVAFELMSRDIRAAGGTACSNASLVEVTDADSANFSNAALAGTASELIARSGDDTAYRVLESTSTSVQVDVDVSDAFEDDDLLLICNARKTFVVQATAVAGDTVHFNALPGGYSPADDEFAPPTAVVLARYRDVRWFVADNDRGGSSLYVSRRGGAREEVAEGVEDLAFAYLNAVTGAYGAAPDANTVAVRTTMTLTGQDVDGQELTRRVSNVVSLRGRTL